MKLLVVLISVVYASATLFEALERESERTVNAFDNGIQSGMSLHEALAIEDNDDVQRLERGIKEELTKYVKEALEICLKQIEHVVTAGQDVNQEALKSLKDIEEKMKDLNIWDEEFQKGKVNEHLRQVFEKMRILDECSDEHQPFESVLGDLSIRNLFIKLKNMIQEKMDLKAMENSLAKVIGQGTQRVREWLTGKGKEKALNFLDRILKSDDRTKKCASEDCNEKFKHDLENIEKVVENKISKFGEWMKNLISGGLSEAKERLENVREIVKEIKSYSKTISRKRLTELLDYIRQYEKKTDSLYDLRNLIQEILNNKD